MLISDSKIVVVGTIRNVAKLISENLRVIDDSLSDFKSVYYYLVESDSDDSTLEELLILKEKYNIEYFSLGELSKTYPNRVERIRHCRNIYVKHVRELVIKNEIHYVLVIDLDGIAKKVSKKGIRSCFKKENDWDACFSNQIPFYHDIYALRVEGWSNSDPFKEIEELKKLIEISKRHRLRYWMAENSIRQKILYSKMHFVIPWRDWIQVRSAFGGLGIYKTEVFLEFDYDYNLNSEPNTCEHVTLHDKLFVNDKKMFINPRLITSFFNPYSLNKYRLIRFIRYLVR